MTAKIIKRFYLRINSSTKNIKMEIVCSTDSKYIMPTGIMLTSLFESNRGEVVNVHLLHDQDSAVLLDSIRTIAARYQQNIHFYLINDDIFKHFPIGLDFQVDHVGTSFATYYRLYLTEILPADIDKVIYLDGDILVVDKLVKLWNTSVENYAIAAVPDSYNNKIEHYNRLRYPQTLGYFNAGMLVVNLKYWREKQVLLKFFDYVKSNAERLKCHDQDVLNYLFKDSKLVLPIRYNVLNEYWFDLRYSLISWEFDEQILEAQAHPAIIHFTGIPKPWYKNCKHPWKKEFDKYKAKSPWRDEKEKRWMPLKFCLEKMAIKLVVSMGLRKSDYIVENRYIELS